MTQIAGVEIPDDLIREAANVADELRPLFDRLMPLLDRAEKVARLIQAADRERVPDRSDEQVEAIEVGTGLGPIADVWWILDVRTRIAI